MSDKEDDVQKIKTLPSNLGLLVSSPTKILAAESEPNLDSLLTPVRVSSNKDQKLQQKSSDEQD